MICALSLEFLFRLNRHESGRLPRQQIVGLTAEHLQPLVDAGQLDYIAGGKSKTSYYCITEKGNQLVSSLVNAARQISA